MHRFKEAWANNSGVQLHYLDSSAGDPNLKPIVFVPGAFGSAELYKSEFESFAPRRCVSMSLRGRGKSDAPFSGYSLQDHADDIAAVISSANLSDFVLMAFSMGVPYAIQFSLQTRSPLAGMVIVDYPATYPKISAEWAVQVRKSLPVDMAKPRVIDGLANDSKEVELWDNLGQIAFPILVLRGMEEGARLSDDLVEKYRQRLPQAQIIEFPESGHELWKPSYERFVRTIKEFLQEIDALKTSG
jgi:pimeloyl-ACP methyl ester carboxylesterase